MPFVPPDADGSDLAVFGEYFSEIAFGLPVGNLCGGYVTEESKLLTYNLCLSTSSLSYLG